MQITSTLIITYTIVFDQANQMKIYLQHPYPNSLELKVITFYISQNIFFFPNHIHHCLIKIICMV